MMEREHYKTAGVAERRGEHSSTHSPRYRGREPSPSPADDTPSSYSHSSRGHDDGQYSAHTLHSRGRDQGHNREYDRDEQRDRDRNRTRDFEVVDDREREHRRDQGRERNRIESSDDENLVHQATRGRESPSLAADPMRPSIFATSKRVAPSSYVPHSQQQHSREQQQQQLRDRAHVHNEARLSQPQAHVRRQSSLQTSTAQTEHAGRAQEIYIKPNGSAPSSSLATHHYKHSQHQHQRENTMDSVGSNRTASSAQHNTDRAHKHGREREVRVGASERKASSDVEQSSRMANASQRSHKTSHSSDEREASGLSVAGRPQSPDEKPHRKGPGYRKPPPVFRPSPPSTPPANQETLPPPISGAQREDSRDKVSVPQAHTSSRTTLATSSQADLSTTPAKTSRHRDDPEEIQTPRDKLSSNDSGRSHVSELTKVKPATYFPPVQQSPPQGHAVSTTTSVTQAIWNPIASFTNTLKAPVVPVLPASFVQDKPAPPHRSATAPVSRTDSRTHVPQAALVTQHAPDVLKHQSRSEPAVPTRLNTVHQPQPKPASSTLAALTSFVRPARTPSPNPHASSNETTKPSSKSTSAQHGTAEISITQQAQKTPIKRSRSPSPLAARESSEDYVNVSPVTEIPPVQPQGLLYPAPPRGTSPTPPTTRPAEGLYGPRPPKSAQHGGSNGNVAPQTPPKHSRTPSPHGQSLPQIEAKHSVPKRIPSLQNIVSGISKSRSPSPRAPTNNVENTHQAKSQALQALSQMVPLPATPPEAILPEIPAPAVPPARSRSPPTQTQPVIPQYAPPPPPFPPNPPNTPVLAPKPRIASQTQPVLLPAMFSEAGLESTSSTRGSTPSNDEKAMPSNYSSTETASPSPLLLPATEVASIAIPPLPLAVEALRKSNATPEFKTQAEPQPKSGVIRSTPPLIHPARMASILQVPGPAVLADSQPQTRGVFRTPPLSNPTRTADNNMAREERVSLPVHTNAGSESEDNSDFPSLTRNDTASSEAVHELLQENRSDHSVCRKKQALSSLKNDRVDESVSVDQLERKSNLSTPLEDTSLRNGIRGRVTTANQVADSYGAPKASHVTPRASNESLAKQSSSASPPARAQASERKYEFGHAPEPPPSSSDDSYAKLFTPVPKTTELIRPQVLPTNDRTDDGEDRPTAKPHMQIRPTNGTPLTNSSTAPSEMVTSHLNNSIGTSEPLQSTRAQNSTFGRPSAPSDDAKNNKFPADWREAIDRAMRTNHAQDAPVFHGAPVAPTNAISRAAPEPRSYAELETKSGTEQTLLPERSVNYVGSGKWVGQEARAAEESTTMHSQKKLQPAFEKEHVRQVQTSRYDVPQQTLSPTSVGDTAMQPSSKNLRPEPRREDSSIRDRDSSSPGQVPRSRSPLPGHRKRVPIESITASIQADVPMPEPFVGPEGLKFSTEPEFRHEHAEPQLHEVTQTLNNSRRNLRLGKDEIHLDEHSYSHTDNMPDEFTHQRAVSPDLSYKLREHEKPSRDILDAQVYHHYDKGTRKANMYETNLDERTGENGEIIRVTSPLPMEERSVSPMPMSPAVYPKALPENPGQAHLTAQAKRLAANDAYRPPTPPLPSHYKKKRSDDPLPSSSTFLKQPTHVLYPDTSTSDGHSLSGRSMLMQNYKPPPNSTMPRSSISVHQAGSSSTRAFHPSRGRRDERETTTMSPTSPSSASFDDVQNDMDDYDPDDEATQTPPSSRCSTVHDQFASNMDNGSYSDVAVRHTSRTKHHGKPLGSSRSHKLTLPPEPEPKPSRPQYRKPRRADTSSSHSGRSSPRSASRGRQHDHDRYHKSHTDGYGRRPYRSMSEKVVRETTVPPTRSKSAPPRARESKGGFWKHFGLYVRIVMSKFFHWGHY